MENLLILTRKIIKPEVKKGVSSLNHHVITGTTGKTRSQENTALVILMIRRTTVGALSANHIARTDETDMIEKTPEMIREEGEETTEIRVIAIG